MIRQFCTLYTARHAGQCSEQTGKGKNRAVLQAKRAEDGRDTVMMGKVLPAVVPKFC